MMHKYAWLLWVMVAALPVTTLAQSHEEAAEVERAKDVPLDGGFWFTPRMIERAIDRITEDGVGLYNFDEIQLDQTRTIMKERLPKWLNENRAEIMTLTNQYIEAILADEPPDADTVAKWAQRVLPLVDGFKGEIIGVTDQMKEFLTEDQLVVLTGEIAAFETGISFASNKMRTWADGQYDPEIDWPRSENHRKYTREEGRIAREEVDRAREAAIAEAQGLARTESAPGAAQGASPTAPERTTPRPAAAAKPVETRDEWAQYTAEFIRKYDLNNDQHSKAQTHLKRAQEARDSYLTKKTREMRDLEKQFTEVKTAPEAEREQRKADAEGKYRKLYEPVENEFNRLKTKLDDIPTREQRRKAKDAEKAGEAQIEKPAAGADVAREAPGKP